MTGRRPTLGTSAIVVPATTAAGGPHAATDATPQAESRPGSQAAPPPRPAVIPGAVSGPNRAQAEDQDLPLQDLDEAPPPRPDKPTPEPPQMPFKALDPAEFETRVQAYQQVLRVRREAERRLDAEERPPLTLLPFMTLRERLARPQPATRFRIEGWLPVDARVMLAAQYKSGKTTAVNNLTRSLVDGDPWLGTAAVTSIDGCLVVIDTEMAETQLDDWYRHQGIRADDRVVLVPLRGALTGFNLLDATVRARWAAHFRTLGAQYVILDCLRPVLDALGLDEQRDGGRFLVAFDTLLLEAGIREALIVHHMGHSGERSRGDSRFRDWPDVEWKLVRQSEDPASPRFISAFGRDVEVQESQLAYDPVWRRLTLTGGGSRRDATLQQALAAVLEVLAEAQPVSFRKLQDTVQSRSLVHYPRDRVRDAIKLGVRTQKIVTEDGPKRALLHRLPSPPDTATTTASPPPVSECAELCDDRAPHGVSECASASIDARTLHTHAAGEIPNPAPHTRQARPARSRRPRRTDAESP